MRFLPLFLLTSSLALASLQNLYVDDRQDVEKGKELGAGGAYERIAGTALYDKELRVEFEILKPRDPVKANGALLVLAGKAARPADLMERGYTVLRVKTNDAAAIRELVSYLRYGAKISTFVLADQRRFLKRAILVGDPGSVESILLGNAGPDNKVYFDGAVVTGKRTVKLPDTLKVVQADSRPEDEIFQLDALLAPPKK